MAIVTKYVSWGAAINTTWWSVMSSTLFLVKWLVHRIVGLLISLFRVHPTQSPLYLEDFFEIGEWEHVSFQMPTAPAARWASQWLIPQICMRALPWHPLPRTYLGLQHTTQQLCSLIRAWLSILAVPSPHNVFAQKPMITCERLLTQATNRARLVYLHSSL